MTQKEKIIMELLNEGGQTDTQLETKLNMRHQSINQACRELEREGLLIRDKSQGVIRNIPTKKPYVPKTQVQPAETEGLHEEPMKQILNAWLKEQGWSTRVAWGKSHGTDIDATKDNQRWIIEVKGCGSRNAMRVNYFLAILGEMLQRMDDPNAKYSIALPDMQQFRNLWNRLPKLAKDRTCIDAIFISENGAITFEK